MRWRYQPPTAPPLPLAAVLSGLGAAGSRSAPGQGVKQAIQRFYDSKEVWLVDSGTSALTLAFIAIRAAFPGRPIALPAFSCYDLATAAVGSGVPVVLYDVEPATLGPEMASLHCALQQHAAAVVVAPLFGLPVAMDAVCDMAGHFGVTVIEDAAQSTGATWRGRPIGAHGNIGVLSFGRGKGVTAGSGGAILLNDDKAVTLMRSVYRSVHIPKGTVPLLCKVTAQWALTHPSLYRVPAAMPWLRLGQTIYREPAVPRWMSGVATRILSRTWPLIAEDTQHRRRVAQRLAAAIRAQGSGLLPTAPTGAEPAYLRLPWLHSRPIALTTRERSLGIARAYPAPLSALPALTPLLASTTPRLVGAQQLADRLLTLPTHRLLSDADITALEAWLSSTRDLTSEE